MLFSRVGRIIVVACLAILTLAACGNNETVDVITTGEAQSETGAVDVDVNGQDTLEAPQDIDTAGWVYIVGGVLRVPPAWTVDELDNWGIAFMLHNEDETIFLYANEMTRGESEMFADSISPFGESGEKHDFVFDDGTIGVRLEAAEGSVTFARGSRYIHTFWSDNSADNDLIRAIVATLTTPVAQQPEDYWYEAGKDGSYWPGADNAADALHNEIVGAWFVQDSSGCQWFVGGESVEFFSNGTGTERLGENAWPFTWALEYVMSPTDDAGIEPFAAALKLVLRYEHQVLSYFPEIWAGDLLLYEHAGPPLVFVRRN